MYTVIYAQPVKLRFSDEPHFSEKNGPKKYPSILALSMAHAPLHESSLLPSL